MVFTLGDAKSRMQNDNTEILEGQDNSHWNNLASGRLISTAYFLCLFLFGMSRSGDQVFFFFTPIPIRVLQNLVNANTESRSDTLTNIFLDNTAALWKKQLHPSCSLIVFYFVETTNILSYGSFLFCKCYWNIGLHLPCVSSWVCDAALWKQTLEYSQLKCLRDAAHVWYLHIIYCFFLYSLCCMSTHCLSISHVFSISLIACFTCFAVWDPRN